MTSFSVPNTFTPLTTISSSQVNANFTAVATAFGNSLGIAGAETMTGALKGSNGAAAAPAFTFGIDTDTGIYRKAANSLGFAVAGVEHGYIDSSGNWVIPTGALTLSAGLLTLVNAGLHLLDTDASHDLIIAPGSDLSADRTLTLTTGDADRTLTLTGDATLNGTPLASASLGLQVFTGSGTYTPTSNMVSCLVISTGGGGGGGGADCTDTSAGAVGSGGGAGSTSIEAFSAATIGASQTVTIGAAGAAGSSSGGDGGNGGDTTFGALHTAGGGVGGDGIQTGDDAVFGTLSAGGTASTGAINISGGPGGLGNTDDVANYTVSGYGGASFWGGGAGPATIAGIGKTGATGNAAGNAGAAYGAGGSGAICSNQTTGAAGGAGAAGLVMVLELIAA